MLQFLQTGKVLYVLAAVCALGIISKLVTGNLYKRLIKETGNMALTKNRNLRALKQKTEKYVPSEPWTPQSGCVHRKTGLRIPFYEDLSG